MNNRTSPSLYTFPIEILLSIFKHLDIRDMCRLRETCLKFNYVIELIEDGMISKHNLLITNQNHLIIRKRCFRILKYLDSFRISSNWQKGIYIEKTQFPSKIRYLPCVQLLKDNLWLSRGGTIFCYKRTSNNKIRTKANISLRGKSNADVCKFVHKNQHVLSGQSDGRMWLWSLQEQQFVFDQLCDNSEINCVDMNTDGDVLISGSRNNMVKLWEPKSLENIETVDVKDRIWAVRFCDYGSSSNVAIGTAGNVKLSQPLIIYNVANMQPLERLAPKGAQKGAGILDIIWESSDLLWTCGYDGCLNKWDLRTSSCVQVLEDPFGSPLFCFEYDHVNSIISGTQHHNRSVLFDTRCNKCVQTYYGSGTHSPVYSVSFDAEMLVAATDRKLHLFDFSVQQYNALCSDYSTFLN